MAKPPEKSMPVFDGCRLVTITIPPASKCMDEIRGMKFHSDEDFNSELHKYNAVLEALSKKYGALCIKTKEVFEGISPKLWRHDNVHLSIDGNNMLYEELCKKILF